MFFLSPKIKMFFHIFQPLAFVVIMLMLILSKELVIASAIFVLFINALFDLHKEIKNEKLRRAILSRFNEENSKRRRRGS